MVMGMFKCSILRGEMEICYKMLNFCSRINIGWWLVFKNGGKSKQLLGNLFMFRFSKFFQKL